MYSLSGESKGRLASQAGKYNIILTLFIFISYICREIATILQKGVGRDRSFSALSILYSVPLFLYSRHSGGYFTANWDKDLAISQGFNMK